MKERAYEGLLSPADFDEMGKFLDRIVSLVQSDTLARVRERVAGMIAEHEHNSEYCGDDQLVCIDMTKEVNIYNTACRDVLTSLKELGSETV